MGDGEKRYTEDQLEKIGELRASIAFAEIQREHLHRYAEIESRGFREETWVGAVCLGSVGVMGTAYAVSGSGAFNLSIALAIFGIVLGSFWITRRRTLTKARQLELMQAEIELERAIREANEAIREAKAGG